MHISGEWTSKVSKSISRTVICVTELSIVFLAVKLYIIYSLRDLEVTPSSPKPYIMCGMTLAVLGKEL